MPFDDHLATTIVPETFWLDWPVDINIRIRSEGSRYCAELQSQVLSTPVTFPIGISQQDLTVLNVQLQGAIYDIARGNVEGGIPTTEELQNQQYANLAQFGHYAFNQVFGEHDILPLIRELSRRISIQVVSEDFSLPWELLYSASLDKPVSPENFWGSNYSISRVIVRQGERANCTSTIIPIPPRLGLLTDCALTAVLEKELPYFEELHRRGDIILFKLRSLNPENKREELEEFKRFCSNAFDVAHFACHAFYDHAQPNRSGVIVSNDYEITLMDMNNYRINFGAHPLIVLNACETGNPNPLHTWFLAAAFLKHGARGVVATECSVPDDFAADFAQELYNHLLDGEPLGESLLTTRRHFIEERDNPTGLLYSIYGPPSIRFVQGGRK